MKRIGLAFCLLSLSIVMTARELPKNVVSVEVGYNTAWMTSYGVKASAIPTFMVGVTDQILLSKNLPMYFETGLLFQGKGYAIKGYEDSKTDTYNLQIPLNVNYHIYLNDSVRLEPGAGLYYAAGLAGNLLYDGKNIDVFRDASLSRHDFGWSCGLNCVVSRVSFGVSYEMGLTNIDIKDPIYGDESAKLGYRDLRNNVFSIRVGVNF